MRYSQLSSRASTSRARFSIHRSAWKRNSANFAYSRFPEVHSVVLAKTISPKSCEKSSPPSTSPQAGCHPKRRKKG